MKKKMVKNDTIKTMLANYEYNDNKKEGENKEKEASFLF